MHYRTGLGRVGFSGLPLRAIGLAALIILACAMAMPQAGAQNLVQNPGFENTPNDGSNTSPGWTLDATSATSFVNGQGMANSGIWAVDFAATDAATATQGTLSQAVTTVPSTYYTVTFFLANEGGPHNTFLATFGGQTVLSLTDANAFGYTQYTATVRATSATSVLAFTAQQDPSDFLLDDISVQAGPLPAAGGGLISFAIAIAGFGLRRMRAGAGRK